MDWSFSEVVDLIRSHHSFGRMEGFFVEIELWNSSPLSARLHAFEFDEAEEFDEVAGVPAIAASQGLRTLLVISNLEDVILHASTRSATTSLLEYVAAVNYYREYDSFKP